MKQNPIIPGKYDACTVVFTLLISIWFNSCNIKGARERKAEQADLLLSEPQMSIEIPKMVRKSNIFYRDICDTVIHIPLETNKGSLIGHIFQTKVCDSMIFIWDYLRTNELFMFDKKGRFLRKLDRKGKGPQEYIRIGDFNVDIPNNQIYVHDDMSRKVLVYDLNYKFIRYKNFDFFTSIIFGFNNKIILYQNSRYENKWPDLFYQLLVYDFDQDKITEKYIPYGQDDKFEFSCYPHFRQHQQDHFYFQESFASEILSYNENDKLEFALDVTFHPDDKEFLREENMGITVDEAFEKILKEDLAFLVGFDISENWMYFRMQKGYQHYYCIYNRNTGRKMTGNYFVNNLPYSLVLGKVKELYKDYLISVIEPMQIKMQLPPEIIQQNFGQIKDLKNANPIVVMAKLKSDW